MNKINPVLKYFLTLISLFRSNIRDYGMYIALAVIFIIFQIMTGSVFLGPINFTNLLNQTAYVAVLAVGMTLVIVTRQIDLSVGYLGAFLGAFVVVAVENKNWLVSAALFVALIITIVVGFLKGFLIAKVKVPSFVVTLAGMFIFKGFLMIRTNNRTISTSNNFFNKLGVGYLTDNIVGQLNVLTFSVGVFIALTILILAVYKRLKNQRLNVPVEIPEIFITKLLFMVAMVLFISYNLAIYKGISWLLLITVIVVGIYHFLTTQTVLGRRIYAVGGNPEAAELSGINVKNIIIIVFISMGILSLVSGVMYASYVQNTSPNHGPFWELYAIAAAYIGGTSANGGVGKVVNAVIGAVVMMSLKNGMALAGVNANIEPIVLGTVLLLAVVFDIYTRNVRSIDLVGVYYARKKYKDEYIHAMKAYNTARTNLQNAKMAKKPTLEFEYALTSAQGDFNRIKDKIRNAKSEDFQAFIH